MQSANIGVLLELREEHVPCLVYIVAPEPYNLNLKANSKDTEQNF
jgi:hypothetical protein